MRQDAFRGHRFPREVILLAVRWYCRYPLSYRDVRDLLAERGIEVDAATIFRWVQKFGPEIAKRAFRHRSWRGLSWHVDETYLRVKGRWCYLWRAVDQRGQMIDFRLTARRNINAARAFLRQAREASRLYQPLSITTDKAHSYARVIGELNRGRGDRARDPAPPEQHHRIGPRRAEAAYQPDARLSKSPIGEGHAEGHRDHPHDQEGAVP